MILYLIFNNDFNVQFPTELIADWVKEVGVKDGMILENQEVQVHDISYDNTQGYLTISGVLQSQMDS
ncbi:hypothetical protein F67_I3_11_071 [Rhizobium phage RHph_I3_11]|nr:hypothetical protein F67_I3_11_071 [Rhizobium phage RHph_I3_11]